MPIYLLCLSTLRHLDERLNLSFLCYPFVSSPLLAMPARIVCVNGKLALAVCAVRAGMPVRLAEKLFEVPPSTIHRNAKGLRARPPNQPPPRPCGQPTAFTKEEESVVLELLLRYADHGIPLSRAHLKEAFEILIERMPLSRQRALPFRNGIPAKNFLTAFTNRHNDRLRFGRPLR